MEGPYTKQTWIFNNYIKKHKKENNITILDVSELKFSRSGEEN